MLSEIIAMLYITISSWCVMWSYLLTLTTPSRDTVRGSKAVSPEVASVVYRPSTLLRHPTHVTSEDRVEETEEEVTIKQATSSSLLRL